jgi:lon-related putative ATP-dependent protease
MSKEDIVYAEPLDEWIEDQDFRSTEEIEIPERMVDKVIGQEGAVEIIRTAAAQKRHVMLIGEPGTGKSMLANSMTDYLPQGELEDVIAYHNPEDPNVPRVRVLPAGRGKPIVTEQKIIAAQQRSQKNNSAMFLIGAIIIVGLAAALYMGDPTWAFVALIGALMVFFVMRSPNQRQEVVLTPKLLIDHKEYDAPPFIDATGSHAGSLLGDVRHDPFQSGGLETPAHERLEVGAIHKASKGVLFIDEINLLRMESQQALLTAMQEGKLAIVGQTDRSSSALVKSEPVPCDFVLVCAGNLDALGGMHPALRSRVRGYGYEVYMKSTMKDTDKNRKDIIRFVAQEVRKDGKIPHFDKYAASEIVREAQRRSGKKGELTLRLRELGGLIRAAGDLAIDKNADIVSKSDVLEAKMSAKSLEQQIADRHIESTKAYKLFNTEGSLVGSVNGLAAMGGSNGISELSGIVLPIVAEVAPSQNKKAGKIVATGQLGAIAKEAVDNISAVIKKYTMTNISDSDIHIQFVGTYDGVEGDSASVTIATAVISAMEDIPIKQDLAMTGSLSVRGKVLPVGAVTAKLEAAAQSGIKRALIPKDNIKDVMVESKYYEMMEIITVESIRDVLEYALVDCPRKEQYMEKLLPLTEGGESGAKVLEPPEVHVPKKEKARKIPNVPDVPIVEEEELVTVQTVESSGEPNPQ